MADAAAFFLADMSSEKLIPVVIILSQLFSNVLCSVRSQNLRTRQKKKSMKHVQYGNLEIKMLNFCLNWLVLRSGLPYCMG